MTTVAVAPVCRTGLGLKYPLELHGLPNGKTPFEVMLSQVAASPAGVVYVPAPLHTIDALAGRYGREFGALRIVYLELEAGEGEDLLKAVTRGCFAAGQREEASDFVVIPPGYAYEFADAVKLVCAAGFPVVGAIAGGNSQTRPDFNVNAVKNVVSSFGVIKKADHHAGTIGPFTLTDDEVKRLRRYRRNAITECAPVADRAALALALNLDLTNGNPYASIALPGRVWDLSHWPGLNWYQQDILEGKAN